MRDDNMGDPLAATLATEERTPQHAADHDHSARPYLFVLEGAASWVFELPTNGEIVVGRGDTADLRLRDVSVSRRHASLRVVGGAVTVTDLGSHNGTYIDGQRLHGSRTLHSGESLAMCSATLVLYTRVVARSTRWLAYPDLRMRFDEEIERAIRYQRCVTVLCGLLAHATDRDRVDAALRTLRGFEHAAWIDAKQWIIVVPEACAREALAVAERIRERLAGIDARLGYSVCPDDGHDADALVLAARTAAAGTTRQAIAGATTSLRTYRIGNRNVIVADPVMVRLYALVERLAAVELPVLITGETGSGKELAATLLHERSPRSRHALVAVNCAAIQESLVESQLFGHDRGAFSGAVAAKPGLVEAAHGGTLFLDEIGELSLPVQAKLLRVLETKRVTRVGEVHERPVDVRLVAATNRDLHAEVDAGRFRQDLLFRINAAVVEVPALRERTREIGLLAELFLAEACAAAKRSSMTIDSAAMTLLETHAWVGNVRELKNAMEYFAATVTGSTLRDDDVAARLGARTTGPHRAVAAAPTSESTAARTFMPIADEIRALEIERMSQALEAAHGNQTRAAQLIGMPVRTFFTKMRQYELRR